MTTRMLTAAGLGRTCARLGLVAFVSLGIGPGLAVAQSTQPPPAATAAPEAGLVVTPLVVYFVLVDRRLE